MSYIQRKPKLWTAQQDEILKSLAQSCETRTWSLISQNFSEISGVKRTAKQCRDRWINNLSCIKNDEPWRDEEINQIFQSQLLYGNQWSLIAKSIKNRSECQIKNFFYSTIRRNIRKFNKGKLNAERIKFKSLSILENQEIREILMAKKNLGKYHFLRTFLSETAVKVISQQFSQNTHEQNTQSLMNQLDPPEMSFTTDEFYISSDDSFNSNFTYAIKESPENFYYAQEFDEFLAECPSSFY